MHFIKQVIGNFTILLHSEIKIDSSPVKHSEKHINTHRRIWGKITGVVEETRLLCRRFIFQLLKV